MDLKVATKNERLNFERLIKDDTMNYKSNRPVISKNSKQLSNQVNENNFPSNNNHINDIKIVSKLRPQNQQYNKTKRDLFWEEKRHQKDQENKGVVISTNTQNVVRGRGNDNISNNRVNEKEYNTNKRGNSVPYYSENNLNYNMQREVHHNENAKMNTTEYSSNNKKFQYESSNRFNNTTNLPGNQQFNDAKSNEYKINNNRPNFSGIKLNNNNIQTNNMLNNYNSNVIPQNNNPVMKNKFNPQYNKY